MLFRGEIQGLSLYRAFRDAGNPTGRVHGTLYVASGNRTGRISVEEAWVTQARWHTVRDQEALDAIFALAQGEFSWDEIPLPGREMPRLHVCQVCYHQIHRALRERFTDLDPAREFPDPLQRLRLSRYYDEAAPRIPLTDSEKRLLEQIRQEPSVEDLLRTSLDPQNTARTLLVLHTALLVDLYGGGSEFPWHRESEALEEVLVAG